MRGPKTPTSVFLLVIDFVLKVSAFNRSHVGVFLDQTTFVKRSDNCVMVVNELIPVVLKISTKFSRMSVMLGEYEIANPSAKAIPSTVATYNNLHLKDDEMPLELTIFMLIGLTPSQSQGALEHAIIAADEANKIYSGTVKRITIGHMSFIVEAEEIKGFEAFLANLNFTNATEYDVGASLPLYYCTADGLPKVLRHIRHLSFNWWPNLVIQNVEPKSAVERLSREFEVCRQKLKEYGSNITVQIHTGWISFNVTSMSDHNRNLVDYWQLVNEWAVKVNATVVLDHAFDVINGNSQSKLKYSGWWKVVEKPVTNLNAYPQFDFVQKVNVDVMDSNEMSSGSWGARLTVFFICLGFSVLFILIMLRQNKFV